MKKLLFMLIGIALITGLMAEVNFYGQVRAGMWYYNMDKDFTGGKAKLDMTTKLYGNSRLGAKFKFENIKGKFELGLGGNNASLRLAYAEYDFGAYSILVGQNYTGFPSKNLTAQAASIFTGGDFLGIGYGAAYDGRRAQIRFSTNNIYFIMMQPNKVNPADLNAETIDALFPKINFGYNYKSDNISLYPTFGLNYSAYNKDRAGRDDAILAYAFATTFVFNADILCLKGQVNYGQNVNNYGIGSVVVANALWDVIKNEVINTTTFGGFLQATLKTNIAKFTLGGTYTSGNNDTLDDADTAMSVFGQANFKLSKNFCIIPEIGLLAQMEDGKGDKEGSVMYFGTKLQAKF